VPEQESDRSGEIMDQLRELGNNLERVIRQAWESETGRELREQFSAGLKEVTTQVEGAVESARNSESVQNLGDQARDAWRSTVGDESAVKLREGIGEALESLNERINDLVETIPTHSASDEETNGDA
jgi:ElaB/YqjD/DUF883 family membrane-anchored ribosome-binding protein